MTPDPEQRLPRELLKELIEEGSDAFRGVLEKLLNTAMQMEREEFLGARRWERSEQRRDHANGYKAKTLSTRVGQLQIRIPQVRHLDFYPRSLERGCRSEKALKLAIAEMYVMGVSTRKVTEITEQLCGTEISASQVSRISKLLDDELEQFRNRPLGSYPVVYLDAHYEKVRRQGSIQDVAVLKATGVNCWGKREVIGVSCRLSEAEVHWREFLQQLQKRGLEGVQLIVSDDHSGLRAARRAVFPSVPWQRCQFHLSQNAQRYARRSDQRAAIATDIRDIFNAPSGGEAEAMLRARVEQYYDRNPELADWMETNLPEGFTVFRFARSTWRRIRTNNGLENLNRQIRRRTRVVGIFPNTESALRLITAVVEEIHEDWLIGKQYLSLVDFKPQENPISDHSQSNYRKTVASKLLQLFVQHPGHSRDLGGRDLQPTQLLRDLGDFSRRDSHHIHLGNGQLQGLLRTATPFQRLGIKPQTAHLWNLQVQLSHSSLNPLLFESVSIASPTGGSLVRFRSQKLASFQLHRHVEQLLQDPSKGFCSFLDQLLQNLPWYSLFQVWVHLILLARLSFLFLENPVPDLCLSDPRPDQKLQKKSYTTLRFFSGFWFRLFCPQE